MKTSPVFAQHLDESRFYYFNVKRLNTSHNSNAITCDLATFYMKKKRDKAIQHGSQPVTPSTYTS